MRTAVVVGFDYHAGILCRKMNAHAEQWRFLASPSTKRGLLRALLMLHSADALISFGGPAPHAILLAAARAYKLPIFVIWAGTDVTRILEQPETMPLLQRGGITHLAVAPWLVEELKHAGINALYLPIIGVNPALNAEIPDKQFNVLSYLPEARRDFYGRPHLYEVAKRVPDANFLIVGAGSADLSAPPNVTFFGWLPDIMPLVDRCAVILRVPDHDGMSLIVLEALARGRFVAWKYAVPGVKQVTTPDDTVHYLNDLRKQLAVNKVKYNRDGLDFITSLYEERSVSIGLQHFLEQCLERKKERISSSREIMVSGLDIFTTDLAHLNNQLLTGWDAEVMQYDTRYEMIGSLYNLARSDVLYTIGAPVLTRSMKIVAGLLKKPRVMHWVGTDIEVARHNPKLVNDLRRPSIMHLTEVDWEAEELRALGIHASIAPLPPRFTCSNSVPELPSDFTLLTYLPRSRTDFYGSLELEFIIRAFRDQPVKFMIVGGGAINVAAGAPVENLGWRYSLDEVYAKSSALLRFTPRDGLSLMVLESLAFGRQVLWTKKFPFVRHVRTIEDVIEALKELLDLHVSGSLKPQINAAEFVRNAYNRELCMRRIVSAWDAAASKPNSRTRNGNVG